MGGHSRVRGPGVLRRERTAAGLRPLDDGGLDGPVPRGYRLAVRSVRPLKVGFVSLQEQFDTSTPIGQAMFTIIGAMAQLERDIIRERVKAGLERARTRGVRLGRPVLTVTAEQVAQLRRDGLSVGGIGRRVHCSRATVRRRLRALGIPDGPTSAVAITASPATQ